VTERRAEVMARGKAELKLDGGLSPGQDVPGWCRGRNSYDSALSAYPDQPVLGSALADGRS